MRILITTGFSGKDVGGPAQYGPKLSEQFQKLGHEVRIQTYEFEKKLPIFISHLYFLLRCLPNVAWADRVIALDTYTIGVPSVMAARLFRRKIIIRIGGDFLWESYTNRTSEKITLTDFNLNTPALNFKEKIIRIFTKYLTHKADVLAFNSDWQRKIWEKTYNINPNKTRVVRNFIPPSEQGEETEEKSFVWAGREMPLKNLDMLRRVAEKIKLSRPELRLDLIMNVSRQEVLNKVRKAHVVILPSISDVSPNFILEGASFGKPFIMTKETSFAEILPRGGIFINPKDENELEKAMLSMLDKNEYEKFKHALFSEYKSRSWQNVAEDFLKL